MAPEIFNGDDYGITVDVYAFGILAYMVITNLVPWQKETNVFLLGKALMGGQRPPIPDTVAWPYRELIERGWKSNPGDRPTFAQILAAMTKGDFLSPEIDAAAFAVYVSKVTPGLSIAGPAEPDCDSFLPYADSAISEAPSLAGTSFAALMLDPNDRKRDRTFKARSGGQAHVVRLVRPPTNEASAAKELNVDDESLFLREVELLSHLRHPVIVGLIGYYAADEDMRLKPTIITEWISGGSLDGLLWAPESPKLSATLKMKIIVGLVLGMRYIHACRVMHRDLKPQNILLNRECEPKIGDLGSARLTD
jgi:serine/threonine protein kinase